MSDYYDDSYEGVDQEQLNNAANWVADQAAQRAEANIAARLTAVTQAQIEQQGIALASATAAQADHALEEKYGDSWRNDKSEVASRIAAKPGLIREQSFWDPASLASDLDTAYRVAQAETKIEAETRQKAETDSFADNLVKAHRKTYAAHMESIHDVLKGDD